MRKRRRRKAVPRKPKEVNLKRSAVRWGITIGIIVAILFPAYWFGVRRAMFNSRVRGILQVYVDEGVPQEDRDAAESELLVLGRRAVPALAGELVKNEDMSYEQKAMTVTLLGDIGDSRAITLMIASVTDDKPHAEALKKLEVYSRMTEEGNKSELALREFDQYSATVAEVLGRLKHKKTLSIVKSKMKGKDDTGNYLKKFKLRVMAAMKDTGSTSELTGILRSKGEADDVRSEAAKCLGIIGDKDAVEPLIEALEYKEAAVQLEAAISLGFLGDHRAVRPLIELFEQPAFAKSRGLDQSIVYALARIGTDPCRAYLAKARQDRPDLQAVIDDANREFFSGPSN